MSSVRFVVAVFFGGGGGRKGWGEEIYTPPRILSSTHDMKFKLTSELLVVDW